MATVITERELRNEGGEIMRRLDQGETFIVTRNGMPVGELSPLRRLRFVTAEFVAALFHHAPPIWTPSPATGAHAEASRHCRGVHQRVDDAVDQPKGECGACNQA